MTTKWFVFLFYSFLFYCHVSLGRGRAPMRISRLSTAALHSRASRSSPSRFPCFKSNLNDVSYVSTTWHLTLHHEFAVSMLYYMHIHCPYLSMYTCNDINYMLQFCPFSDHPCPPRTTLGTGAPAPIAPTWSKFRSARRADVDTYRFLADVDTFRHFLTHFSLFKV